MLQPKPMKVDTPSVIVTTRLPASYAIVVFTSVAWLPLPICREVEVSRPPLS